MKTLQEKYNAVLEGKFSKTQFVRDAKRELPQFISPYNGFEDSISILKRRGMLTEMKLTGVQVYDDRVEPTYSLDTLERGIDYELEAMGLMSNETVSDKDYGKAKKKAVKNLEKDPIFYTKNAAFKVDGIGYQALKNQEEPTGKYKSSGYGDLKEIKNVKFNIINL